MAQREMIDYICDGCDQQIDVKTEPHVLNLIFQMWMPKGKKARPTMADLHEACIGLYMVRHVAKGKFLVHPEAPAAKKSTRKPKGALKVVEDQTEASA